MHRRILMEGDLFKYSAFSRAFEPRFCVFYNDGKCHLFLDKSRAVPVGILRAELMVALEPCVLSHIDVVNETALISRDLKPTNDPAEMHETDAAFQTTAFALHHQDHYQRNAMPSSWFLLKISLCVPRRGPIDTTTLTSSRDDRMSHAHETTRDSAAHGHTHEAKPTQDSHHVHARMQSIYLRMESPSILMKWARSFEREARQLTGRTFDLTIRRHLDDIHASAPLVHLASSSSLFSVADGTCTRDHDHHETTADNNHDNNHDNNNSRSRSVQTVLPFLIGSPLDRAQHALYRWRPYPHERVKERLYTNWIHKVEGHDDGHGCRTYTHLLPLPLGMSRAWFFVKAPLSHGISSSSSAAAAAAAALSTFHPRFVVFHGQYLCLYKYEVPFMLPQAQVQACSSVLADTAAPGPPVMIIDFAQIQDVVDVQRQRHMQCNHHRYVRDRRRRRPFSPESESTSLIVETAHDKKKENEEENEDDADFTIALYTSPGNASESGSGYLTMISLLARHVLHGS
jgi:hypothetical protein